MKIKTADLIGRPLRYAVAVCEGFNVGVVTVDEQWERFMEGVSPEDLEKYAESYAAIKAGFKTELCRVHSDGYKSTLDAQAWHFDEDWGVGGPIIERETMSLCHYKSHAEPWFAEKRHFGRHHKAGRSYGEGPTPLIAAMRCFCCAKLGDEIEIPQELQLCQQPNL